MIEPRYRAAPPEALRVEPLGDLTAIFDRRSVQTHLVVSPMPEILAAMDDEPCDAATLAARLAAEFEVEAEGDVGAIVAERLHELAALGLVAPA